MIFRPLLPSSVLVAEADMARLAVAPDDLHPAEVSHAASLGPHREAEFLAGRLLYRRLLHQRGGALDTPLLPQASGAPIWPAGLRGSITHASGQVVVVLGDAGLIGIDLVSESDLREFFGGDEARARNWAVAEAAFKALADDPACTGQEFRPEDFVLEETEARPQASSGTVRSRRGGPALRFRSRGDARLGIAASVVES